MLKSVLFSILLCFLIPTTKQEIPTAVKTFAEQKLDEFARDYPGISVSVSLNGKIAWNRTAGFSDINQQKAVSRDTKFNIYSTSKLITGLAYLKLVHSGKIKSLDQKIREIDPSLPKSWDQVTLRHVLSHTSGIRHYKGKKDWMKFSNLRCSSPAEAMEFFKNDPLKFKPGQKDQYTTFGMVVASHLLEKITGKSYVDALNELLPFSTDVNLDGESVNKATPYVKSGSKYKVYECRMQVWRWRINWFF